MRQLLLAATTACLALAATTPLSVKNDKTVLILGGGVAGIIAARTLAERNITDVLLIEARPELGGRMRSLDFGSQGNTATIELGANWVQGAGGGNPILALAAEHGLRTVPSDFYGSVERQLSPRITWHDTQRYPLARNSTYDENGEGDYLGVLEQAIVAYTNLSDVGVLRASKGHADMNSRAGYSLMGMKPETPLDMAAEYFMVDWQYAQTPEQTSWIASSMVHRYTYDVAHGGFSGRNLLSVDQRGFKHLIQAESEKFLQPEQVLLNATVRRIAYSPERVVVTLADGTSISADYVISTFSLGVLQNDDVLFRPALPMWKMEAIHSMTMATYTKIFLQFDEKFWFDTQFALYADKERGRYPVWQSLDLEGFLPGSGILFATVTGDYARRIELLSDAQVLEELLSVLQTMFPNTTIPSPTAFLFPRWTADPLYRGSYSNWPASFVREHHTNLRANVGKRLWFAGEATSLRYFGYLHGAYLEGMDIAAHVADCVLSKGDECVGLPFVDSVEMRMRNSGEAPARVGYRPASGPRVDVRPFLAGVLSSVLPYSWWWWCVKAGFVP
ncbi:amine oxidase [Roridomyces roridus]|uniref:Amine oxidase n=1 Tax=Roridomyces roridus TaxID=1738132 RepID=A0AAD7BE44_9AGAR|nr:amine oxidase [Roridomyces roridus]